MASPIAHTVQRHCSSNTLHRRALLFPLGNSSVPPNDSVSIYLDYADPKTSDNWHACAQFALVLSNTTDPTNFVVSRTFTSVYLCSAFAHVSPPSQTPTIDSSQRSVIGVSLASLTSESYSNQTTTMPVPSLRTILPLLPSLSVSSRIQQESYGTIS